MSLNKYKKASLKDKIEVADKADVVEVKEEVKKVNSKSKKK